MSNYVIEEILKHRKITDYLDSKGIAPIGGEVNGKLKYRCPLHQGDNDPSFMVYTQSGPFENFYCYGCKAKYHIIHLYSLMEKVSFRAAIKALSGDLELDAESEINHAIREIEQDHSLWTEYTPAQLSLLIGRQLYDFSKRVENDPASVECVETTLRLVDHSVDRGDLVALKTIYDTLPDVLFQKVQQYDQIKEERIKTGVLGVLSDRR